MFQFIKNLWGDYREHPRCPITGDTMYEESTVQIPYASDQRVVIVLERTFSKKRSLEEIAKTVWEIGQKRSESNKKRNMLGLYTPAEILSNLKKKYPDKEIRKK